MLTKKLMGLAVMSILLIGMGAAAGQTVFVIEFMIYQDETVTGMNISVADGTPRIPGAGDEYTFLLQDDDGTTLQEESGSISMQAYTEGAGIQQLEATDVIVRLPYNPNATTFALQKNGGSVTTVDIPSLICVPNDATCPRYCSGRGTDSDCRNAGLPIIGGTNPFLLGGVALVLAVIGAVLYFSMVPEREEAATAPQSQPRERRTR